MKVEKSAVQLACLNLLNERIDNLIQDLKDLKEGAQNDAKSTAGDKHETSRAMVHIEFDRNNHLLNELLSQKNMLLKIDMSIATSQIALGSVVETDKGTFYVSIPLGRVRVNDENIMTLSPASPLGSAMAGRKTADTVTVNGTIFQINQVY